MKESQVIRAIATIGFSEYVAQKFKVSNLYLFNKCKLIHSYLLRKLVTVNFIFHEKYMGIGHNVFSRERLLGQRLG